MPCSALHSALHCTVWTAQGFKKGKKLKKMGMKAQDTSELFFEDLRVPKSALLGAENKGFYMVMQASHTSRRNSLP